MGLHIFNHQRHISRTKTKNSFLSACLLLFLVTSMVLSPRTTQAQAVTVVLPPTFSVLRGFYTAPFQLTLSAAAGATIRYTTDGSTPSPNAGNIYNAPINIAATTAVRAVAYVGSNASVVATNTYIFINTVRNQSNTPPAGWPSLFAANTDTYGPYPADYEMDPDVVNHANYKNKIEGALLSVPTVSLVTDLSNLWDPNTGIYYNPNEKSGDPNSRPDPLANKWERPVSLEWLNPDGTTGFAEMAGAKMHGQASRRPKNTPKHSFRISFKSKYGASKLNYHLFDFSDAVGKFDEIVLRNGGNRTWSYYDRDQRRETDYVNDEWSRRTWLQMGHLTARGTFVNLYINGLYWGLYEVTERIDEKMLQAYLGGQETDYDFVVSDEDFGNTPTAAAGTIDAYNELTNLLNGAGPISDATYQLASQRMDMVDFADYMLHTHYIGKTDWPNHNWDAYRKRTGTDTRFRWMTWDDDSGINKVNQPWDTPNAPLDYPQSPSWMFLRLITNTEFRQLFADRVYKNVVAPDGVLTPANCAALYTQLTNMVDQAVIGESARWGDYVRDVYARPDAIPNKTRPAYLYSRDLPADDPANFIVQSTPPFTGTFDQKNWVQVRNEKLSSYCPGRGTNLISQYVNGAIHVNLTTTLQIPLYQTTLVPPAYSQRGGAVPANYNLLIQNVNSNNAGDIYYTTDGSDPRAVGGTVGATATLGNDLAQTLITKVTNVKARVKNGANWSPLMDYMFYPPQPFENLVINEVHYHPTAPVGDDADHYQFIELYNRGTTPLQLDNVAFTRGVSYHFPVGSVIQPDQYIVLVSDPVAFATRYPGVTPFGDMRGSLSNAGEQIDLSDAVGNLIDSVTYTDLAPWPTAADGTGPSMELMNPGWDNALGTNWKASLNNNGTPGAKNSTFLASIPPTVALTSPTGGTGLVKGTPVTIAATATDSDNAVANVAFFVDGAPIANCVDTTAPYECNWTPTDIGDHSLTAQATDALGVAASSSAVTVTVTDPANVPPTVSISSPTNGATAVNGSTIQVVASASDPDGSVAKVIFFANGTAIPGCEDTTVPYECSWTPAAAGDYSLTAQAIDNGSAKTTSAVVSFTVTTIPNTPPTVAISSPANGSSVSTGRVTTIVAAADDADGTVSNVTFFANGTPIDNCVDTAAPYECRWTPPADGSYSLTAQAIDDQNAVTLSAKVNVTSITVPNKAPTAQIISPVSGSGFQAGKTVTIQATASDPDGTVAKVVFFANNAPIDGCTVTTLPYECAWTPAAGIYNLTVQATDNDGATSDMPTGTGVSVTINPNATSQSIYMPLVVR